MQRSMHGCINCAPSGRPRRAGRRRRLRRLRSRPRRPRTRRSHSESLLHPHPGEDTEAGVIARLRGSWTPSRACSAPIVTPGWGGQGREDLLRRAGSRLERDGGGRPPPQCRRGPRRSSSGLLEAPGSKGRLGADRGALIPSLPDPRPRSGPRPPPAAGPGAGAGPLRDLLMILLRVRPERGARRGLSRSGAARKNSTGDLYLSPCNPLSANEALKGSQPGRMGGGIGGG